jgi:hypothetical protein
MQNPLSYLGSLLAEPQPEQPLDAQVVKTCTKWDVAQMLTDDLHKALQELPLNTAEDFDAVPKHSGGLCSLHAVRRPGEAAT